MSKYALHPLTANINKKQKNKSKQLRMEAISWLAKTFPQAFDDTQSIHPLKKGIMDDILAHAERAAAVGISKSKLREAVISFTRKIDYLTCLKAREMRIDLDGNPTDQVTEEEATQAADKIKKHIEKSAKIARQNTTTPAASKTKYSSPLTQALSPQAHGSSNEQCLYTVPNPSRATTVVIKSKNKSYDPEAVARLKEKLGISE